MSDLRLFLTFKIPEKTKIGQTGRDMTEVSVLLGGQKRRKGNPVAHQK